MLKGHTKHIVGAWIANYADPFYDFLCKRAVDREAAKDILQETFMAAWKNSGGFQSKSSEKTWLLSI